MTQTRIHTEIERHTFLLLLSLVLSQLNELGYVVVCTYMYLSERFGLRELANNCGRAKGC